MLNVDVYILIGGRSSRFGTDKAFVEFDGETLACRAARTAKTALEPEHVTFIAASNTQFDPESLAQLDGQVIFDVRPGFGAWSALHAALVDGESEWVFVQACDLPFTSVRFLRFLASFANGDIDAVIPRHADERAQPLCAFYQRVAARAAVETFLAFPGSLPPLSAISGDLKTRIVESNEYSGLRNSQKFLYNVNTTADLDAAARKEVH